MIYKYTPEIFDEDSLTVSDTMQQPYAILTHLPGQNGRRLADDIFRCIFMNEKFCFLIKLSLKFIRKCPISNNPALV